MKTFSTSKKKYLLLIFFIISVFISCKKTKDAQFPTITFKTGSNYTSSDLSVNTSEIINVGITADKNEGDLKTYKIYSSKGSGSFSIRKTFYLTPDEKDHYENDYQIKPENKYSYETWKFEITDSNGNSTSILLKLTVN